MRSDDQPLILVGPQHLAERVRHFFGCLVPRAFADALQIEIPRVDVEDDRADPARAALGRRHERSYNGTGATVAGNELGPVRVDVFLLAHQAVFAGAPPIVIARDEDPVRRGCVYLFAQDLLAFGDRVLLDASGIDVVSQEDHGGVVGVDVRPSCQRGQDRLTLHRDTGIAEQHHPVDQVLLKRQRRFRVDPGRLIRDEGRSGRRVVFAVDAARGRQATTDREQERERKKSPDAHVGCLRPSRGSSYRQHRPRRHRRIRRTAGAREAGVGSVDQPSPGRGPSCWMISIR